MKQSEKLLKLKDAGTILISLGILIMCITPVIMVAREVYDFHAWLTVWRWGVGVAFTGLAIRIARFLYLWQYSLGSPSGLPFPLTGHIITLLCVSQLVAMYWWSQTWHFNDY